MANDVDWPGWPEDWTPFVQGGEDLIEVKAVPPDGDLQQVGLQSSPNVTWLKRIRVLDANGVELATVSTQDSAHGPGFVVLPPGWARLEFVKAKILGVPTGMYATPPQGQAILYPVDLKGWSLLFLWKKD
jgi:hypothetical protein